MVFNLKRTTFSIPGLCICLMLASCGRAVAINPAGHTDATIAKAPVRQELAKRLNQILSKYSEAHKFSGTLQITLPNGSYTQSIGLADDDRGLKTTANDHYLIASVSKQWVAAGIMRLQEQGLLNVLDPVSKYFPEYPKKNLKGTNGQYVRIQHLLNHTSGIVDSYSIDAALDSRVLKERVKFSDVLKVMMDHRLESDPGEEFKYADSTYDLLGEIIRRVSGKSSAQFFQSEFLQPLNLSQTSVGYARSLAATLPQSYDVHNEKRENYRSHDNFDYDYLDETFSDGNIFTTVTDMSSWLQALISRQVLSEKSLQMMWQPSEAEEYGYGWYINNEDYRRNVYFHEGEWIGFSSFVAVVPEIGASIVWLSNYAGPLELRHSFKDQIFKAVIDESN